MTTTPSYERFGNDGFQLPQGVGFLSPEDQLTRIRNNGGIVFIQDDWQLASNITLNLGVRYEADYPRLVADAIPLGPGALGILALVTGDPFILHNTFGIPIDAVVTRDNVSALTGLSPDAFVAAVNDLLVSTGIPFIPVDFSPFTGFLRQDTGGPFQDEIRVADQLRTPFNRSWSVGVEREVWNR